MKKWMTMMMLTRIGIRKKDFELPRKRFDFKSGVLKEGEELKEERKRKWRIRKLD
jgi:hypothetical protein